MMVCRELSTRSYPQTGVTEGRHPVSHHRNNADLVAKKTRIDTYHVQLVAYFLEKMKATRDGDGSPLDQSMILCGCGMGDGNLHRHNNLPCLMAGKLGGQLETGRRLAYKLDTPMSNPLVTILHRAGVPVEKIGDSTGLLEV